LVYGFSQCFARFKVGYALFRNLHTFTRSGVASYAGRAAVDGETSKSANLNAMAFEQGIAHGVKHRFDGKFCVAVGQLLKAGRQGLNKIGAGHGKVWESNKKAFAHRKSLSQIPV